MPLDQAAMFIITGGIVGLVSAVVMSIFYHRIHQNALQKHLENQRVTWEHQLNQERDLFAQELKASRELIERQLETQREELLLDRLSKNPTDEQRNEIMKIQWARDLAHGYHLQELELTTPINNLED